MAASKLRSPTWAPGLVTPCRRATVHELFRPRALVPQRCRVHDFGPPAKLTKSPRRRGPLQLPLLLTPSADAGKIPAPSLAISSQCPTPAAWTSSSSSSGRRSRGAGRSSNSTSLSSSLSTSRTPAPHTLRNVQSPPRQAPPGLTNFSLRNVDPATGCWGQYDNLAGGGPTCDRFLGAVETSGRVRVKTLRPMRDRKHLPRPNRPHPSQYPALLRQISAFSLNCLSRRCGDPEGGSSPLRQCNLRRR